MFQLGSRSRAVGEQVGRQPHRGPRREDVVPARDVLLEDVVLGRAAELLGPDALLLGHQLVEQQEERRGRVDRHRGRDLVERDRVEEQLHVGDRVDRDAGAPDLAGRALVVGVVAELRRQVEGDREARLPAVEQVAEALVRLLGRGEARVLADRPRLAAVHVRVGAARERVLARRLELARRVVRVVDGLDLDPGVGLAPVGLGHQLDRTLSRRSVPAARRARAEPPPRARRADRPARRRSARAPAGRPAARGRRSPAPPA